MNARLRERLRQELPWVLPAVLVFVGLCLWLIWLAPSWVGDSYDDGGYFLMSRNVWRYGAPLLDQGGTPFWSGTWSPFLPLLLSPIAALPMKWAVIGERLAVLAAGAAVVIAAYWWMRSALALPAKWSGIAAAVVGASHFLLSSSSRILSDTPALAALMTGLVLLRRGRPAWAGFLWAIAFCIRPSYGVALGVLVLWLLWQRSPGWRVALVASLGPAAAWTLLQLSQRPPQGYTSQLFLRDLERPELGNVDAPGMAMRLLDHLRSILTGEGAGLLASALQSASLVRIAGPLVAALSVLVMLAIAIGLWRLRLSLEGMLLAAITALALVWPWDPQRFLLPLLPLGVGVLAALLHRAGPRAAVVAAMVAVAVIGGDLQQFHALTPSRAAERARIGDLQAVFVATRAAALAPNDLVLSINDIQTYLYTGIPTGRSFPAVISPQIRRVLVVDLPYGSIHGGRLGVALPSGLQACPVFSAGDAALDEVRDVCH
ncbi:MAG: hypothetical protein ACYDAY_01345 [Candidatus Dormibacteria bacterium]